MIPILKANQIRNGRAMLGWGLGRLATKVGFSIEDLRCLEDGTATITQASSDVIRHTLETAGIEFIPETDKGAGVRLRKESRD